MIQPISRFVALAVLSLFGAAGATLADAATTQTIVFVRHGEKPVDVDNGQLTCQGHNRAIALANVLLPKYGTPAFVFAAAPVENQDDNGVNYWYLRALATIEPSAVAAGVTIDLRYDKSAIDALESELAKSKYAGSLSFVAWEHNEMDQLVANIVHDNGGDASVVPAWSDDDYDSIFVVTLIRDGSSTTVSFAHDAEGLDNLSTECTPVRRNVPLPPRFRN
jgi:hypothetical protein